MMPTNHTSPTTSTQDNRWLLLRYDIESTNTAGMDGFLQTMQTVHQTHNLPVSLFCTGGALDARETAFRAFHDAVGDDPLFEIGDHSYSHVGVGYERGKPVDTLRVDYERSLEAHERILGKRPDSLSLCGTGGVDGPRLSGFDSTTKGIQELAMLASLGFRRLNSFALGWEESKAFVDYAPLGYPDIIGFPSGFSDTVWLRDHKDEDFLASLRAEIDRRAEANLPMPVIMHDWVAWQHAPDQQLTHVLKLAEYAHSRGYTPMATAHAAQVWRERRGTDESKVL